MQTRPGTYKKSRSPYYSVRFTDFFNIHLCKPDQVLIESHKNTFLKKKSFISRPNLHTFRGIWGVANQSQYERQNWLFKWAVGFLIRSPQRNLAVISAGSNLFVISSYCRLRAGAARPEKALKRIYDGRPRPWPKPAPPAARAFTKFMIYGS